MESGRLRIVLPITEYAKVDEKVDASLPHTIRRKVVHLGGFSLKTIQQLRPYANRLTEYESVISIGSQFEVERQIEADEWEVVGHFPVEPSAEEEAAANASR